MTIRIDSRLKPPELARMRWATVKKTPERIEVGLRLAKTLEEKGFDSWTMFECGLPALDMVSERRPDIFNRGIKLAKELLEKGIDPSLTLWSGFSIIVRFFGRDLEIFEHKVEQLKRLAEQLAAEEISDVYLAEETILTCPVQVLKGVAAKGPDDFRELYKRYDSLVDQLSQLIVKARKGNIPLEDLLSDFLPIWTRVCQGNPAVFEAGVRAAGQFIEKKVNPRITLKILFPALLKVSSGGLTHFMELVRDAEGLINKLIEEEIDLWATLTEGLPALALACRGAPANFGSALGIAEELIGRKIDPANILRGGLSAFVGSVKKPADFDRVITLVKGLLSHFPRTGNNYYPGVLGRNIDSTFQALANANGREPQLFERRFSALQVLAYQFEKARASGCDLSLTPENKLDALANVLEGFGDVDFSGLL